ncbi:unnamed protein product [Discosporangium mesarthrocarpum]
MKHKIEPELLEICKEILIEDKTLAEWSEIECGDWFQTENYIGGFEAEEQEFTFSYYDEEGKEFWFQINMEQVTGITNGQIKEIDLSEASE